MSAEWLGHGTTALGAAILAGLTVCAVRWYAIRRDVVDYPNERSSHVRPTPRGGGVGVVLPVLALLLFTSGAVATRWLMVSSLVLVAVVGWADDHRSLSWRIRLFAHFVAGIMVAAIALSIGGSLLPGRGDVITAVWLAWWVFWAVSAINVTNFMDGIDALIGLQLLVFGIFAAIALRRGDSWMLDLSLVAAGASVGFLAFNWPPAKVFMGDVGSGSIGILFVLLGVLTIGARGWTILHAFLPLLPLFADELVTMLRRIRRAEKLTAPHHTHVYQEWVKRGWSHGKVSATYAAGAILGAAWSLAVPVWSTVFVGGVLALLGASMWAMLATDTGSRHE